MASTNSFTHGSILFNPKVKSIEKYIGDLYASESTDEDLRDGLVDMLNYLNISITSSGIFADECESGSNFNENNIALALHTLINYVKENGSVATGEITISFDDGDDETIKFNVCNNNLSITTYELVATTKPYEEGMNIFVS